MAIQTANTAYFYSNSSMLTSLNELAVVKVAKTFLYYSGNVSFISNSSLFNMMSDVGVIKLTKPFNFYSGQAIQKTKENDFYWEQNGNTNC